MFIFSNGQKDHKPIDCDWIAAMTTALVTNHIPELFIKQSSCSSTLIFALFMFFDFL